MPRASLDSDHPAGESQRVMVKLSPAAKAEAMAARKPDETLSEFIRAAIRREIQRRKRKTS